MSERTRMILLIFLMIMISLITVSVSIIILYNTSFEQQRMRLTETVQSQARLIEAIARFDIAHQKKWHSEIRNPVDTTMSQVIDAHNKYKGFGETGEFVIARREGDSIIFLLKHLHKKVIQQESIQLTPDLAEPMRKALLGESGTIIGLDYRGIKVLAAYEYIKILNYGIVAKIDISEIREPFVKSIVFAAVILVLFAVVGIALFIKIGTPIIRLLEERASKLEKQNKEMILEINRREMIENRLNRLVLAVESSDEAIISKNLDGTIETWNYGAEKIYGYTEKEVEGKPVSIIIPQNRHNELYEILDKIRNGKRVDHYETVRKRKDGAHIDISLSISPIKDFSGKIVGASSIARDITEHKLLDKKLADSEQRFRSLIEFSLTGISIIQDDQIIYQNPEQEKLFGPLPRVIIFKRYEDIHPDDVENVKKTYQDIVYGATKETDINFRFFSKDEETNRVDIKWLHCRANLIKHEGKDALIVNIMDITMAKEIENVLRIQDKMTSLGHVTAGIAHEIRNPLSGINIYLNTLEKMYEQETDLGKIKRILGQIQSASSRIESVIKRVMDFSKPSNPNFVLMNINEPIEESIKLSLVTLRKSGIKIEEFLAEDLPKCKIDPNMIEQVILNFITNSADAMKEMAVGKKIRIISSKEKTQVRVSVSDSGPGVNTTLRDKIFDPFFSTKNGSTGIGLSICQRIIMDHGGTLEVLKSKLGGAEFRIEIPSEKGIVN